MNKMDHSKTYKILSYNVMSNTNLAGLLSIIDIEKPDLILIQELVLNTEHLSTFIAGQSDYVGVANVDELEPNKPGVGMVWRKDFPVSQVTSLETRRLQSAYVGPYPVINVYPPAGSENAPGRREFFKEQLFRSIRGLGTQLPIIGGDFNCVLSRIDIEGGDFGKKKSSELQNIVREFNLQDSFRYIFPNAREYTWSRRGLNSSRLDRFYIPQDLVKGVKQVSHHPYLSDHKYVKIILKLPALESKKQMKKDCESYWKLNTSILDDEDFMPEFSIMWERVKQSKEDYEDIAEWWEEYAKPESRALCIRYAAQVARSNRCMKDMLMVMLTTALEDKRWDDVAFIRGRLTEIMRKENLGFIVRSRYKENLESEKGSLFHVNREKKKGSQRNLNKLVIGGQVVEDKNSIEDELGGFFGDLFHGHHRKGGVTEDKTFEPDFTHLDEFLEGVGKLSEDSKAGIEKPINMGELELAVKQLSDNKAPGLDGLPREFYNRVGEVINNELLEVLNCQLDRLLLVESNKHGATRLVPKVEEVPRVDQLRPITLLCLDYKILTKVLATRLVSIMGEIIKSGQSCGIPGKNILFGAHNILSVVQYIEKYGGKAAVVSYDLMKAYDRVHLGFLYKVMEAMNFGQKFINWVKTCHQGATTRLLVNFITRPIDLLISVRQGDPMAMELFEVYIEPLLVMIRKSIKGTRFVGERIVGQGKIQRGCVLTLDEDYVDDCNVVIQNEEDLLKIDDIFNKFENMSGAILNRSNKSKIMGLGDWEGKDNWCLPWLKVEKSLKIFGITFTPRYDEILEENWRLAKEGFTNCLRAWKNRALESVFQRVEVLRVFALPKLWFKALLLPLPARVAASLENEVRNFIWRGKMEKPAFTEMCNSVEEGGLNLPCLRSKADSLLLKQLLRMLEDTDTCHHDHLKFWLGNFQTNWGSMRQTYHGAPYDTQVYAKMEEDRPWDKESALTKHYKKLLLEFEYGQKNEYYDKQAENSIKKITAKTLYQLNTTTFTPPAIVFKRELDWSLAWGRVGSIMVEPKGREMLYMIVNNLFPTQERLWRMNRERRQENRRVFTDICQRCNQGVVGDCVHLFCECTKVREGWLWLRRKIMLLLPDCQRMSNFEILHLQFPQDARVEKECMFLLGNWVQMVQEEVVVKDRDLEDQFVRGTMQYKYLESRKKKMPSINHIPDVTIFDPG